MSCPRLFLAWVGLLGFWWFGWGLLGPGHTLDTPAADTTFQSARDCTCVVFSIAACTLEGHWRLWVFGCLVFWLVAVWFLVVGCLLVGCLAPHWPSARGTLDSESVNDCPPLPVPPRLPFDVEELPRVRLAPVGWFCWVVGLLCWLVGLSLFSGPSTYSRRIRPWLFSLLETGPFRP